MLEYIFCTVAAIVCAFLYDGCTSVVHGVIPRGASSQSIHLFRSSGFRRSLLCGSALCLWAPACLRANHVGTDTGLYVDEYYRLINHTGWYVHSDWGFQQLNLIVGEFTKNSSVFLSICAGIAIFGFYYLASMFRQALTLEVILFILSYNYFQIYSLIAQYVALGFLFIGIRFLLENRYLPALLFALVAGFMHSSAWVFLLLFLFKIVMDMTANAYRWSIASLSCLVVFSLFAGQILPWLLRNTRFSVYYHRDDSSLNSTSFVIINLAVLAFMTLIVFLEPWIKDSSLFQFFYVIEACGTACSLLQNQVPLMVRMVIYFSAFIPVSIPLFINALERKDLKRMFVILVLGSFAVWFLLFPVRLNYYNLFPYEITGSIHSILIA